MSGTAYTNAAPMVRALGTQDLSTVAAARVPDSFPQHLPLVFIYAKKGRAGRVLLQGAERDTYFGKETFDPFKKYFNHSTVFANGINSAGGSCIYSRIIPQNAGPKANMTLWLDVLPTQVPRYERNDDGSFVTDGSGNKIQMTNVVNSVSTPVTTSGFKVKWVVSHLTDVSSFNAQFGNETAKPGDQIDVDENTQSTRYPIMSFAANSEGEWGNFAGIRMWAPTTSNTLQLPTTLLEKVRAYPINIAMVEGADASTSPSVIATVNGDQYATLVAKKNAFNTDLNKKVDLDQLTSLYSDETEGYPEIIPNFDKVFVYYDNIDGLLGDFHDTESAYIDSYSDITNTNDDRFLINIVNFVSSTNVPYETIVPVQDINSVSPTQYTNILAGGGSDGQMDDESFAEDVIVEMNRYLDPNDSVMDMTVNPESIIYDSGFPLEAKYALCQFIGYRKDTFTVLSTYTAGEPQLSMDEEMSLATALRTRLQNYPESTYFGTETCRGAVVGFSSKIQNNTYTEEVPLSYEWAVKFTNYMGAANGIWKNGSSPEGAPNHVLQYQVKPSVKFIPSRVANRAWNVGLNWVQPYSRAGSYFIPAYKTVYTNDTSIFNSVITSLAIGTLTKIANNAWKEVSGRSDLKDVQLINKVNEYVNAHVQGIFDSRFVIVPGAMITQADSDNGFSWQLPIKLYGNNQKTVMTTWIEGYRMSALTAQ